MLILGVNHDIYSQSKIQNFKKLSGAEKWWVLVHPFVAKKAFNISQLARVKTDSIKQNNILKGEGSGSQVDAFRHTFWMAKLTKEIGSRKSKSLGKAHEKGNYRDYKKRKLEDGEIPDKISSEMDFYNNDIGIRIGKKSSDFEIEKIVIESILNGECKIIKVNSEGKYLDIEGKIIPNESLKGKWENNKCLVKSNELP